MTQKQILSILHKKNRFILTGTESYFTNVVIREIKKNLLPEFETFNFIEFEHKNEEFSEAQLKIASTPMFDNKKIVHIKNFIFSEENGVWNKDEIEKFYELSEKLDNDTILILSNNTTKNITSTKYYKKLSKIFEAISFEKLKAPELTEYIINFFDENIEKGAIKKDICIEIANSSGYLHKDSNINMYDIENLLKKITSFYYENNRITKNDLAVIFEKKEDADIFELINAISTGNKIKAFKEYFILIEKGEAKIKMLTTIGKIFSNAIKVDFLLSAGYSKETIMKELGKNIYAINNAERLARKVSRKKLIQMLDEIIEVDYKMKKGILSEDFYAEILLIKLFDIIG